MKGEKKKRKKNKGVKREKIISYMLITSLSEIEKHI